MGMNKTPIRIEVTAEEGQELERLSRAQRVPHRTVVRARTILRLATGKPLSAVVMGRSSQRSPSAAPWGETAEHRRALTRVSSATTALYRM